MSNSEKYSQVRGFLTPPPKWRSNRCVPVMPRSERKPWKLGYGQQAKTDLFHIVHKVPAGDSPYVKAKHVQVIDKDPSRAVSLFWAAINAGDRVDSALKDMAVVMKQLNRSDEAIEAIKSFRHLCPLESQESLDNVLIELYKRSGRVEEEIQMLQLKIKNIEDGIAFDGKRTKMARSQGKKVQITIEKEYSRLLGNLAWAYLQLEDYKSAEENYRKALSLEPDKNKQCNLAICLIHLNKTAEAKFLLESVKASCVNEQMEESYVRSFERAAQMLDDLEMQNNAKPVASEDGFYGELQSHFPLGARRKLKGFSGDDNAGQCDLPGAEKFNGSANVHCNQMVPLHDLKGIACFWKHNESNPDNPGSRNAKETNGGSRRNENQFGYDQVSLCASPGCLAGTPEDPFTQPRKCLRPFNGDQKRSWHAEDAVGGCNKKLTFEQHKDCANSQFVAIQTHARFLSVPANRDSISAGTKVSTSENWRKNMPEDCANISSENNGDCERNILESDEQHNAAQDECKEKHNLLSGLSVNSVDMRMKHFSSADCEQSHTSTTAENVELIDAAINDSQNQKSSEQLTTCLKEFQEFSESKKSWADMVEEDEQQLQSGTDAFPDHARSFQSDKLFLPCRTPSKISYQLKGREDFSDENYNTNIILQTPASLNHQSQNLSKNFRSLGLRDDYYTQPHHDKVSLNEHQKSNTPANSFSSPLLKRSLDFECENSMSLEQGHATSNDLKLMRRNRLQVFRSITPGSPRC